MFDVSKLTIPYLGAMFGFQSTDTVNQINNVSIFANGQPLLYLLLYLFPLFLYLFTLYDIYEEELKRS